MTLTKNIVLVGYRGTGKSCTAEALSQRLGIACYSLDALIVEKEKKSIPEIVQANGWDYFRDVESEIVRQYALKKPVIIDAGGGVVLKPENVQLLKKHGMVFWLKAAPETIISRIQDDSSRPALTEGKTFIQEIEEVLSRRLPLYKNAADVEIDTDGKTIKDITEDIIAEIKRSG